jgi:hypothetical protein
MAQAFRNHVQTVFPVISQPKDQLVGSKAPKVTLIHAVTPPVYLTEMDVTRAIASGTFKGFANEAYSAAKQFQNYLKRSKLQPSFRLA